jgi:hypothetical protein
MPRRIKMKTYPVSGAKADQQMRLVNREFPWLWAIRSQWWLGGREVLVRNVGSELETILKKVSDSDHDKHRTQVWIRSALVDQADKHPFTRVDRVWPSVAAPWADKVVAAVPNWQIHNVVVIVVESGIEKITLFRQKEPLQINRLLCRLTGRA